MYALLDSPVAWKGGGSGVGGWLINIGDVPMITWLKIPIHACFLYCLLLVFSVLFTPSFLCKEHAYFKSLSVYMIYESVSCNF